MNEDLKNKIVEDIHKTGYLSELKAASIILKKEWSLEQNSTYLDKDSSVSREIDLIASKCFFDDKYKIRIFVDLVIEVKKSKRPWVIFSRSNDLKDGYKFKGPAWGMITGEENLSAKLLSTEQLMEKFMRNSCDRIGTSFYEAFKSPDEPSKIFEAVMSAIKAAFYQYELNYGYTDDLQESNSDEQTEKTVYSSKKFIQLSVFIPVVIVNGTLIDAYLSNAGNIELEERNHIPLETSYSTRKYADHFFAFYPEVVTLDGFEDFMDKTILWGEDILNSIRTNVIKLKKKK